MAIERRQVLIVHGWSDSYQSFQPLKSLLVAAGYETTQVFLGNYASMRDDVTFDDLATGLQQRFVEMIKDGALNLEPFSLDVIVHSTGGPVVRHWLSHYLRDICGGDLARCPVRSLIMLAPANFGSRLAAHASWKVSSWAAPCSGRSRTTTCSRPSAATPAPPRAPSCMCCRVRTRTGS